MFGFYFSAAVFRSAPPKSISDSVRYFGENDECAPCNCSKRCKFPSGTQLVARGNALPSGTCFEKYSCRVREPNEFKRRGRHVFVFSSLELCTPLLVLNNLRLSQVVVRRRRLLAFQPPARSRRVWLMAGPGSPTLSEDSAGGLNYISFINIRRIKKPT